MTAERGGDGIAGRRPIGRNEGVRFLIGAGRYLDDVNPDRVAHGLVLRSPHAHARLTRIDTRAAVALPGVLAVFTGPDLRAEGLGDLPTRSPARTREGAPLSAPPRPALAVETVRFVGDPVAFVVAETIAAAKDAAEAVEIEFAPLPAVTDAAQALQSGAPLVWDHLPSNLCLDFEAGDEAAVTAAFAGAAHITRLDLTNNRVTAVPIEPRGAIGHYHAERDGFTLVSSGQNLHANRDQLAEQVFNIPRAKLRHLAYDVGGGFGAKNGLYPEHVLVLFAARRLGRPVKWVGDRSESFLSDTHGRDQSSRVELALDSAGRFLALKVTSVGNTGAYFASIGPFTPTGGTARTQGGPYRIPALLFRAKAVFTHTAPTDPYRGAGRPEATYQIERVVDLAARELDLDPAELRRRNLIRPEDLPYRTGIGLEIDSGAFEAVLDRCLKLARWTEFPLRAADGRSDGRRLGIGVALYLGLTGGRREDCAALSFEADGSLSVAVGSESPGTGLETVLPQIVAERLAVPFERITYRQGDTDLTPIGAGHGGSHGLEVAGSLLRIAADQVIEKAKKIAGHMLETAEADLDFHDGGFYVVGTDRFVSMDAVIAAAMDPAALPAGMAPGLDVEITRKIDRLTYPNGCHVAEVAVDPDTGAVRLLDYTVVHDFGTIVHPVIAEGQVMGATAQGIGQALLEKVRYASDTGQMLSGTLMDYGLPRADDLPRFRSDFIQDAPTALNPLGVKGAGEAGCGGAPPAVVSAVVDALKDFGVRHIDMPLTPHRVWRAIQAARAGS